MSRVYVSVGSNIEPENNVRSAVVDLRRHFSPLLLSSVYESEAVGFEGDNFYNLVVGFDTADDVYHVASVLRQIEDAHARDRKGPRFSPRTVDLDLLLYDDKVINESGLNIPRDEITENAFVLWPLAEIGGEYVHPLTGLSLVDMWQAYDKNRQALWPIDFSWE